MWGLVLLCALCLTGVRADGCVHRDYGTGSTVCVCNATYCDALEPVTNSPAGNFLVFSSSKEGLRFHKTMGEFLTIGVKADVSFTVDRSVTYQNIFGFGGAMTDAAGINIASLSKESQDQLMNSYFSQEGIEMNIIRVPMAGSDFSTYTYSYDDVENDTTLENFKLTEEDLLYKIPYIKQALALSNKKLLLLSAPWSAPKWMKTNNEFYGMGKLKKEYYQLWADYYIRFFEEYQKEGLDFWAVSAQNEPNDGLIPNFSFSCMGWSSEDQMTWVGENLGPTLESSNFKDVKLLILDDQRLFLPSWTDMILGNSTSVKYVSGMAVHWYLDSISSEATLQEVHEAFPEHFLLYTEACNGVKEYGEPAVILGSWERGEKYAESILETLNNWVTGWVDWNFALSETGGPNWADNFVDSAIIVNKTADEFYRQPTFYVLAHFSKFVPEGSVRIHLDTLDDNGIENIAFLTPDGSVVVVLLSRLDEDVNVTIADEERGSLVIQVPARSIHTVVYW